MSESARWFIGAATTSYRPELGFDELSELAGDVERMAGLFAGLGYRRVPGFRINMASGEFLNCLRAFLTSPERLADDIVVVYYTGHGAYDHGSLLLPMADATADVSYTAMPAEALTGKLLAGRVVVQRLLFILDVCYAAPAGRAMAGGPIEFLARPRGLAARQSTAVLLAARANERATSGEFTRAFVDAVSHRASGGHEPDFLALDGLANIVNETTPDWQGARLYLTGDGITEFIPNPRLDRWLRDLDLRTQALQRLRATRRAEQRDHVLPRAQGLDTSADNEDLWLFTGRHQALSEVCGWLRSPDVPAAMVVTGDPGSGKSALLSRLFVLADRKLRGRVPRLHTLPELTVPPLGAISRFIHARGMTGDELMAGICEACDVPETRKPSQLLDALAGRTEPVVVIVDALDEAVAYHAARASEFPLVDQVLAPLIRAAGRTRLRLLLGTRRHLLPALGEPLQLVDLDAAAYADPASVAAYARSCLVQLSEQSPYRRQPQAFLNAVAEAIADAAGNSFLVALITARSLALRDELADPTDLGWRHCLPRLATDAMRDDLYRRLGGLADQARELLLPLAYAQGSGLPWEDLWPKLARALSASNYTSSDIDWLIEVAGFYIVESASNDGRSTYRLYHEALAEHLRADRDNAADQTIIVDALIEHVSRLPDGQPDWQRAHPYIRANIATYATGTDRLEGLVADPRFLLAASSSPLMAALSLAATPDALAVADAYRRAEFQLRTCSPECRPAYLQLAARCAHAPRLADAITASGLPLAWRTDWASWRLLPPHRTLVGHAGRVRSVAVSRLGGRTVIVSGGDDATMRVWDATTGASVGDPLTGHTDWIYAIADGQIGDQTIIASGSGDRTVRVWDAATGVPVGEPLTGHTGWVTAVAVGQLDGRTVIVSGADDATVRIWDAATGSPVGGPLTGHTGGVWSVAVAQLDGRTVIVSGASDHTVRVWDPAISTPAAGPLNSHQRRVTAVAAGPFRGRIVLASGAADRTVRLWDAATGSPVGGPLTGHTGTVWSVAVAQLDGRTVIVSGADDATVRIWDATTGSPVGGPLTGHTGSVWSVAVAQLDGRTVIVSGANDRTVRLWDAATGPPTGEVSYDETTLVLPDSIDLSATAYALTVASPSHVIAGTELGIVSMRLPGREATMSTLRVDEQPLIADRFHVGDAWGRPVGREAVLSWLRDRHATGASVALLGPRRSGKTWLLNELSRRLRSEGLTSVHKLVLPQSSARFDDADALAVLLDRSTGDVASPTMELLSKAQRYAGTSARLVFLVDEVGRLAGYQPTAVSWLRDLGQAGAWLVFTGTEKDWHNVIRRALRAPGSSFGNDVNAHILGPWDKRTAVRFVSGTAENLGVHMNPETTGSAIVDNVGTWPFYLQVVGDAVVRAAKSGDLAPLSTREALRHLVTERLIDEWTANFQSRWAEIGPAGRSALLDNPGSPPKSMTPAQRGDLLDVGLLRPGDRWLMDPPLFAWIARNAMSLRDLGLQS